MTRTKTETSPARLGKALAAFDEGARVLELAYRELWAQNETERGTARLLAAERIRDLAHELRNPLGGVSGLAALLRRELERDGASPKARRLLDRMGDGLLAMESLLRTHSAQEEESADAGAIAEETAGLALAENRANGSARRFREVLSNLIRNGAQACEPGGTVRIRIESDLERITVWVEDDGSGLPAVPDDVLFRRGFSTKGSGRGRGLALACELVEEAGGTITFCRLTRGTLVRLGFRRR